MAEIVNVDGFADLVRHMRETCPSFYPADKMPTEKNTEVKPYCYDARIGWDTYIVTVDGHAWGFTNGAL